MAQQHQSMTDSLPANNEKCPSSPAKPAICDSSHSALQNLTDPSQPSSSSLSRQSAPQLTEILLNFKKYGDQHHEILVRISSGTFSADKLIRLLGNIIKVIRNFKLLQNMYPAERMSLELGQFRRLLRVDRLCLVGRDTLACLKKDRLMKKDYLMTIFRGVLVTLDCSDVLAYLIQLKVVKGGQILLQRLRRRVADLYFLECICWLFYYSHEYLCCQSEQHRHRSKLVIIRYLFDIVISHNDFSGRRIELSGKITSILGVISSILNLYIAWK